MPTPIPTPAARRVLVVEDLDDSRESLKDLLRIALEVEVDAAPDGAAALELLAAQPYGLVLTDLRMPRVSGMSLLREVQDKGLACAVIVITAHGAVKEAVEAMRLGAYDFLTKPVDPQYLCCLVERVFREREAAAAPAGTS